MSATECGLHPPACVRAIRSAFSAVGLVYQAALAEVSLCERSKGSSPTHHCKGLYLEPALTDIMSIYLKAVALFLRFRRHGARFFQLKGQSSALYRNPYEFRKSFVFHHLMGLFLHFHILRTTLETTAAPIEGRRIGIIVTQTLVCVRRASESQTEVCATSQKSNEITMKVSSTPCCCSPGCGARRSAC
jgi:hypothetical protein